jgi:fatty-acyl-CoA synthase
MRGAPAIRPKYAMLVEMLDVAAQSDPGLVFVNRKEQDQDVSFARIREQAQSVAGDLVRRGVRKGDRVALVLPTSPEFVQCFFSVLCAGAIPVPLYPPLRLGKLDEFQRRTTAMLKAVDAAMVVTDERIRRFLGVAVANSASAFGCVTASSLGGPISDAVKGGADDVAVIQFSSGTTNDPKPVALNHANLLSNLTTLEQYITADGARPVVGVTWLPLYHDMGLIGNLLSAFYVPAKLVLLPPELFVAVPGAWLRAISRHRGTITAAPNFAFGLCSSA